ncbi:MAG: hypothetical protein IPI27_16390 [Betaproteobacteria bacterium]|nr:hypothetical protein [Betaproteobacteria bacterium]
MKHHRKTTIWSALGAFALASIPQLAPAATLTINGCATLTVETDGTITCNAVAPPPPVDGAPTGCTVKPSSVSLPNTGGEVNAPTVACTGGGQVAQTTWTRLQASVSFPVALPANALGSPQTYTYAGSVCTATNLCTPVSYSATVAAGETVPPVAGSCGNLKVITPTEEKDASNTTMTFTGQRYLTSGLAGADTVAVAKIVVPADISGLTTLSIAPWGVNTTRRAWLSKTVCDTSANERPYMNQAGGGPTMNIKVGGDPDPANVHMQPGETWYLMVKNEQLQSSATSCTSGSCDIGIKLYHP